MADNNTDVSAGASKTAELVVDLISSPPCVMFSDGHHPRKRLMVTITAAAAPVLGVVVVTKQDSSCIICDKNKLNESVFV
ncbi:hypothetical protein P8452_65636 [Trifolium repens]|nr:hypothetical protein P8452_65636 [Trifolium repens]